MHRPRAPPGGCVVGAAGQRPVVDRRVAPGLVGAHLDEPFGRASVQPQLVDRLSRSDRAQLGRAVGGQHDQRHAGLPRLDHGGVKVGRGAAGGAGYGDRPAARLGHPQRGETGAALVDHRDRLEPGLRFSEQGTHYYVCPEHGYVLWSPDGAVRVVALASEPQGAEQMGDERKLGRDR